MTLPRLECDSTVRLLGAATLCVLLAWSAACRADVLIKSDCWTYNNSTTKTGHQGGVGLGSASCPLSVHRGGILPRDGQTFTEARAYASGGDAGEPPELGVRADSETILTTTVQQDFFGGEATGFARVTTEVLPNGQYVGGGRVSRGYLDASIRFDWRLSLTDVSGLDLSYAASEASLKYSATVGGSTIVSFDESLTVFADESENSGVRTSVRIPWVYGVPLTISMEATAFAAGVLASDGNVIAASKFDNSLHWLGFSNVTDEVGTPLARFSAVNTDGTYDWANNVAVAVPEPTAYAMALTGTCIVFLIARRRQRC